MLEQQIEIINKLGLHARASAKLVSTAARFSSDIKVEFGPHTADAKSIMSVMMLAASVGSLVKVKTNGSDEQAAMEAVTSLINNYFDEEE
jgi:phosphocarrier protein